MLRVHGDIRRINLPAMEHWDVHSLVYDIMSSDAQRKVFEENLEVDFSFEIPNLARFPRQRVQSGPGCRRGVPYHHSVARAHAGGSGHAQDLAELALKPRGLVLVTGRPVPASPSRWRRW